MFGLHGSAPWRSERPARPPLDDVMLAMDVVDTLRHRQLLVDRELASEDRDRRMMDRLRRDLRLAGHRRARPRARRRRQGARRGPLRLHAAEGRGSSTGWRESTSAARSGAGLSSSRLARSRSCGQRTQSLSAGRPGARPRRCRWRSSSATRRWPRWPRGRPRGRAPWLCSTRGRAELAEGDTDGASGVLERMQALKGRSNSHTSFASCRVPASRAGYGASRTSAPTRATITSSSRQWARTAICSELPVVNEEDGRTYQGDEVGAQGRRGGIRARRGGQAGRRHHPDNRFGIKRPGYPPWTTSCPPPGGRSRHGSRDGNGHPCAGVHQLRRAAYPRPGGGSRRPDPAHQRRDRGAAQEAGRELQAHRPDQARQRRQRRTGGGTRRGRTPHCGVARIAQA
ncbi:MAG: DUF6384 family protein [Xanthobacteraceae bacterium]|nr:DUF6384 family protein [Xanthobacteraceae bacterium]